MRLLHPVVVIAGILCAGCAQLSSVLPVGRSGVATAADDVTIMRDRHGVPHIFGDTDAAVAFGIGYAQAEDAFQLLEEQYLHALGRAAHWYGERYLATDLVQVAFEVERLAREEYAGEPAAAREMWDAFAAGINYYIGTSGVQPRLLTHFEPWMPFALARMVPAGTIVDGVRLGTVHDSAGGAHLVGERIAFEAGGGAPGGALVGHGTLMAAAPTRTADGDAMLLYSNIGPFDAGAPPWEFMARSDAGWHVRGHAPLGSPVPAAGHNGSIAWAHSAADVDAGDAFRVLFDHPSDPLMYRYDDGWRRAYEWQDTLLVNTPEGVQPREFTFRRTHHGPVVAMQGDTGIALRFVRPSDGGSLQQLLAESRATTLDAFRSALDRRALVAHALYADTAGTIYRLLDNTMPVRDTTLDWSAPVDGGVSATGWSAYVPMTALGETLDPARGLLHAGHAAPATNRLLEATDSAWTLERWSGIAFDTWLPGAEQRIAALIVEWEQVGGANAARARQLDEAVELLRSWDHVADTSSAAATLFVLWQERLHEGSYIGEYGQFSALEGVVAWLEQEHGTGVVPWGAVNRLWRPVSVGVDAERIDLAVSGAPFWAGGVFVANGAAAGASGQRPAAGAGGQRVVAGGTRLVVAVQLGTPVRMRSVIPFGQVADPASRHWADQASAYVAGALKEAWFTRSEVEAAAVEVYRPGRR